MQGIAIAHTSLKDREVIRRCQAIWKDQPLNSFELAVKWVPVDHWCLTDLETIKQLIDEKISSQIGKNQTWGMKIQKRRWQKYHTHEIVEYLAAGIERKVDLSNPDWVQWIDILGRRTAVSLPKQGAISSIMLP